MAGLYLSYKFFINSLNQIKFLLQKLHLIIIMSIFYFETIYKSLKELTTQILINF